MLISQLVSEFRKLVTDERAPYRYSDTEVLGYFNQALVQLAKHIPALYTKTEVMALVPGAKQAKPAANLLLFNVLNNRMGPTLNSPMGPRVTEVTPELMDAVSKNWMNEESSHIIDHIVGLANSNDSFYVYPPAATPAYLEIYYNVDPPLYTSLSQDVSLPRRYLDGLPYYMAFLTYNPDDAVEGNLTKAQQMFAQYLFCIGMNVPQAATT